MTCAHVDGRENDEERDWDLKTTTFAKERQRRDDSSTCSTNNGDEQPEKCGMWGTVLMDYTTGVAKYSGRRRLWVQTRATDGRDVTFTVARLVALAKASGSPLLVAKMGINKAFDTTDLDKAQAAANTHVGPAVARRLVREHTSGRLQVRIPGATTTTTAENHHVVHQGSLSSPALCTLLMEAAVWEPWSQQGEREGWGIDFDGKRLMRMTPQSQALACQVHDDSVVTCYESLASTSRAAHVEHPLLVERCQSDLTPEMVSRIHEAGA